MTKVSILAGLIDNHIEIFEHEDKSLAIYNGKRVSFFELPKEFVAAIWNEIESEEGVIEALESQGFLTKEQQLEKVSICRYGNLDNTPDITQTYELSHEFYDCKVRDTCPMQGIVCKSVKYNGHVLTPFELKMISLLATEDTLPVIAEKLSVCANTLDTRKKYLFEKFEVLSRPRLVALSFFANLIPASICQD